MHRLFTKHFLWKRPCCTKLFIGNHRDHVTKLEAPYLLTVEGGGPKKWESYCCNGRLALTYTATLLLNYMTEQYQALRAVARVNSLFNQEDKEKGGNDNTL